MMACGSPNTDCQPTDFSGATGKFDATAASLPGLADGGAVGSTTNWIDQVSGTRFWSQGTAADRPILHTTGGPNSQPYISFDATDNLGFSAGQSNLLSASACTIFAVVRPQRNGVNDSAFFCPAIYRGDVRAVIALQNTGGGNKFCFFWHDGGLKTVQSTTTYSQNVWYIVECWYDGTNINIKVNDDATVSLAAGSNSSLADPPNIGLFGLTSDVAGSYFWNVDIGSTNRGTFRTCLGNRFGISV